MQTNLNIMKRILITVLVIMTSAILSAEVVAEIKMSPLFTDNMVLQQRTEAPVWGEAEPGSAVSVYTSWNKSKYETIAAADGKWMIKVRTPKAGGPYFMTVSENGTEAEKIENILIGEVWLCSGQSNMEMPLKGWGKVMNYEQEIKDAAKYPKIRLLEVQKNTSPCPIDDFTADSDGWMVCSPQTIEEFSSTAYFFGRELHLKRNVPVGLINTSWGGTIIEAWMSHEALEGVKSLEDEADMVAKWPASKHDRLTEYQNQTKAWNKIAEGYNEMALNMETDFASCCYDDSGWASFGLPAQIEKLKAGFDGHVLVRRTVEIPSAWDGQEITFHCRAVDDKDMTYFNGTLIGETDHWNMAREYKIPAELVKSGKALVAIRIVDHGSGGGISGEASQFFLQGPDGQRVSLAGDWKYKIIADYSVFPPKPLNMYDDPNWSTVLYNSMINPLVPYAIKGAIWYQGCSNTDRSYQYRDLMSLMIDDWRNAWGYDFPFYITQLSNFMEYQTQPCESSWAELREAQDIAARVTSNTGMAVTIDIGDANDIHPKNKQEVGRRLALQAMNKTYGMPVLCSGPVYEGYEIDGNIIRIRFSSVGKGLVAKGDALEGFAIAGADRNFHWGEARIVGNCVEVTCKDVERPVAVRYAWANNPVGNLFNADGLPAGPFRTDDWPGVTFYNTSRY